MAIVPEPEECLKIQVESLEAEVRALRYALGLARAQIEMMKNEQDD